MWILCAVALALSRLETGTTRLRNEERGALWKHGYVLSYFFPCQEWSGGGGLKQRKQFSLSFVLRMFVVANYSEGGKVLIVFGCQSFIRE